MYIVSWVTEPFKLELNGTKSQNEMNKANGKWNDKTLEENTYFWQIYVKWKVLPENIFAVL